MPNLNSNRIDAVLTDSEILALKTQFTAIESSIPFLTGLTPEERIALPKINVSNKIFVEDALMHIRNTPGILPAYLDAAKIERDYVLFGQLDELLRLSKRITEKLEDTMMLAGSEAYVSALTAYRLFGAASQAGIAGSDTAYSHLQSRFSKTATEIQAPDTGAEN